MHGHSDVAQRSVTAFGSSRYSDTLHTHFIAFMSVLVLIGSSTTPFVDHLSSVMPIDFLPRADLCLVSSNSDGHLTEPWLDGIR